MPENQISKLFRSAEGLVKPETVQINGESKKFTKNEVIRRGDQISRFFLFLSNQELAKFRTG